MSTADTCAACLEQIEALVSAGESKELKLSLSADTPSLYYAANMRIVVPNQKVRAFSVFLLEIGKDAGADRSKVTYTCSVRSLYILGSGGRVTESNLQRCATATVQ